MRFGLQFLFCFILGSSWSGASEVRVVISDAAPEAVRFGAEELRKAAAVRAGGEVTVFLGTKSDSKDRVFAGVTVPEGEEAFAVAVRKPGTIVVLGSDPTGAMYGALEVAENWKLGSGPDLLARTRPVSRKPFLAVRGVNMLLTTQGFEETDSWYWSDDFWTKFLDMMARDRLNFLDFHGTFDLTVAFTNTFPYLIKLADYSEVGVSAERAARNLAQFQKIARLCSNRGIKVGLMNYVTSTAIGTWKSGEFWKTERYDPRPPMKYLDNAQLEDYTRKAVEALLRAVPNLWIFGFRIGESGQHEDFYKRTYLEVLKGFSPKLNVYAITWLTDPRRVSEIGNLMNQRFFVEASFNGEQLGLPYQAATGGRQYPPGGSYESYTDLPRSLGIIWKILGNGPHRIFQWGDPDFARRTVRSCKFGGGIGYSLGPMSQYSPQRDYTHNSNPKYKFDNWVFEQQWFWYLLWGRTAYDPEVSDEVWSYEFGQRYGERAGALVLKTLVEGSKIVPFVYSYHNQGLDHQDMAPEFENGNHYGATRFARATIWTGKRLVPYDGDIDYFLKVGTLDLTAMDSPKRYVPSYLENQLSGAMTPYEAADYLEEKANKTQEFARAAEAAGPTDEKNFTCLRLDMAAVSELGLYYAEKIRSATDLEFYYATHFHGKLQSAYEHLQEAIAHWDKLSAITEQHYDYVPELIRMRVYKFRWRDEGRSLGLDLRRLDDLEAAYSTYDHRVEVIIGHVPALQAKPSRPLPLVVNFSSSRADAQVEVLYRNDPEKGFKPIKLKRAGEVDWTYTGEIPAEDVIPGILEYYFEASGGVTGHYGSTLDRRSTYRVHVTEDQLRPIITASEPPEGVRGSFFPVRVKVSDNNEVARVWLHYKPIPAAASWLTLEMTAALNGEYRARIPLTPSGILYYFQAVDTAGNATRFPDFLQRTPYYVVPPWDASPGSGTKAQ